MSDNPEWLQQEELRFGEVKELARLAAKYPELIERIAGEHKNGSVVDEQREVKQPKAVTPKRSGKLSVKKRRTGPTHFDKIAAFFVERDNAFAAIPEIMIATGLVRGAISHLIYMTKSDCFERPTGNEDAARKMFRLTKNALRDATANAAGPEKVAVGVRKIKFKGMTATDAVLALLQESKSEMTTDVIVATLSSKGYGSHLANLRQSVYTSLMRGIPAVFYKTDAGAWGLSTWKKDAKAM